MNKKKIKFFIILYSIWSVLGFYADYNWLSAVPIWSIPFTAICSLYPPMLVIWYLCFLYEKSIPNFFTFWLIVGTFTYGILAQFYFPLLMSWKGVNFHDLGSMFWVAVYGCQAFFLFPKLNNLHWYHILPAAIFLLIADGMHYFIPTFVDFNISGYPIWMKELTVQITIFVQIVTFLLVYILKKRTKSKH